MPAATTTTGRGRIARLAHHVGTHVRGSQDSAAADAAPAAAGTLDYLTIAQRGVRLGDPQDCTDSADTLAMNNALYDCLVRWGPNGNFEPALAESWTVSADCRTWTFQMRGGVRFTNGEPCDAEAAAYSLRRMARPDVGATLGAPAVWGQYLIDSVVTVLGPLSVSITTVLPIADLLDIIAAGPVLPPLALETPGGPESFAAHPIGTGPWMVVTYEPGVELVLAPNPDTWHAVPSVGLRWVAIEAAEDRLAALRSGAADLATRLTGDATAHAADIATAEILENTAYIYLLSAAEEGGMCTEVRKALNLAVDRDEIIEKVLGGEGRPLYTTFSPVHLGGAPMAGEPCANSLPTDGASGATVPPLAERQAQARALLAEAGHPDGFTLKVDCPTSLPDEGVALTELVTTQLAAIGVELDVTHHEDRTAYANTVRLSEVGDMCVFDSSPLSTYRVIREKLDARMEGSWWLGYKNERLNEIVDEASETAALPARRALYEEAVEVLREDPPWLTLYHHTTFVGMRVAAGGTAEMVQEGGLVGSDGILDVRALP
jgi:peptide/nickel transport system substrate-binding protein